jgi:hypothetical protein
MIISITTGFFFAFFFGLLFGALCHSIFISLIMARQTEANMALLNLSESINENNKIRVKLASKGNE